ncbi:MAG: type II toxin-antitoxin system PemK/MazF family toxin [Devosia nanyangense]|uniref:Type II toxin-antitoxin system PemK/MazF family toxin n=1 Tax=Devosia nanyangense TaxID=1228055 RepID=A0A933NXE8_9HYPH|nr:type II toxin-antitoxin system PemK/MazF family toxin [Devosia nanyangense]
MICDFGDVAVVPFPFVDMAVSKHRPALVLSTEAFNSNNDNTLFAMITTAKRSGWPSDVAIVDGATAGLIHQSYVRWKVFTLPNELIRRTAGALGERDRAAVAAALRKVLP